VRKLLAKVKPGRRKGKGTRVSNGRKRKSVSKTPVVPPVQATTERRWVPGECACNTKNKWGENISLCWPCVHNSLYSPKELKRQNKDENKKRRQLIARHGKKTAQVLFADWMRIRHAQSVDIPVQ